MENKSVNILGVRVDKMSMEMVLAQVEEWIRRGGKHYIVTTNPEFVMAAQKDPNFKRILNNSDLSVADGIGLKLAGDVGNIIAGVDLVEEICGLAAKKGVTVGFLGGRNGVAVKAADCLKKKYPGLKVVLAEDGPMVDMNGNETRNEKQETTCDILFVAFGQVKQEKWIAKNLPKISVKVAMGVGGSFDEISGTIMRIPKWVQCIGLKWLFRLILQPWRIKRQVVLIEYMWMVLTKRVRNVVS